jgi:hypothetical protein
MMQAVFPFGERLVCFTSPVSLLHRDKSTGGFSACALFFLGFYLP